MGVSLLVHPPWLGPALSPSRSLAAARVLQALQIVLAQLELALPKCPFSPPVDRGIL